MKPLRTSPPAWLSRVPHPLVGCWYLGSHWDVAERQRSRLGDLVYEAKTRHDHVGNIDAAHRLGELMVSAAREIMDVGPFPLSEVTRVLAVPAFPRKRPFNLPDVLADHVADGLGIERLPNSIEKVRSTVPAKQSPSEDILSSAQSAYVVHTEVEGEVVLVVDDLVHTGATLAGIADHLLGSGAIRVGGYAATRPLKISRTVDEKNFVLEE